MALFLRSEQKTAAGREAGREKNETASPAGRVPGQAASAPRRDPFAALKVELHKKVIAELADLPLEKRDRREQVAARIGDLVDRLIDESGQHISRAERLRITGEIIDEAVGFGPITPLLKDPEVTEIMVNGPRQVYVERGGRLELTGVTFRDDQHVMHVIEKIVAPLGRRIDESAPMVDARLPDGSRVNAIIPPLALNGPTVTIRKFFQDPLTVDDLMAFGTLTREMVLFLEACVRARLNMIVSGGTASGKTSMLNILSSFIPADERIITIEDAAELQLRQEHVVTLESRPANIEGRGEVTIRDLVRNALRMRPDRIVVGEVRGKEALDMLQAMNTGHDGSLTTAHANSPRDVLSRLETMVLMAGMDLPVRAIREQISSAVDVIIHMARLKDGSRKVTHVTEVQGMEGEVIVLQDIFLFEQTGIDGDGKIRGRFRATGIRPKFTDRLEVSGLKLPLEIFRPF